MRSTLDKANKLLIIEKSHRAYFPERPLPEEYHKICIPAAGFYFRQDKECDILTQHLSTGPFSLWMHDIFAKKDIVLLPYTPYHILSLHYMFEDTLRTELPNGHSFMLEERECNLFNLYPGINKVPMATDTKILSVHINIRPESMPDLVRKHPALSNLAYGIMPITNCAINEEPHHINQVCDYLMQKLLSCRYEGSRAYYYIQRICTDLLLNFAQQDAAAWQPFLFTNILHMDTYQQIFDYLVDHPHKSHTLPELAYMFYLSPDQLSQGFRQHFSMPLESFMYMLKKMMTYNLLHKKQLSLDDVAEVAGYHTTVEMVLQMENYYDCKIEQMR